MKITENIKKILEQWEFNGNIYLLPKIQLDRKDYQEVNKVLESLWGKWKTKVWHIFNWEQEELENALQEVLEQWETTTLDEIKKQFQYYPTPKELAEKLVELADIQADDFVLEPSAWQWAILEEFPKYSYCFANELNGDNYEILIERFWQTKLHITCSDFMDMWTDIKFNKIIANPPFSKNQDVKHILHMYDLLEEWWRLVSIASNMIQHKTTNLHKQLMDLNPKFIPVEEWAFKNSWTMVSSVIVVIDKD